MACKLVTCPESDHLETIAFQDTPFGVIVERCTRFEPGDLGCSRKCAARRELDIGDTTVYALRLPARQ